jgi:RNA polymerase sigma-70 factor (ECF subfamily)
MSALAHGDGQDRSNREWVAALRGPEQDGALAELRAILVRGLRFALAGRVPGDLDAFVEDIAQESLLRILRGLDGFRGESRFTTWAQKVAIHVALTDLRRRRWQDVLLDDVLSEPDGRSLEPLLHGHAAATPEQEVMQRMLMELVLRVIRQELTARQRRAILAVLVSGMPMDEVARRMGINRNALYKLLFDARQRLRRRLEQAGISTQDILATFVEG